MRRPPEEPHEPRSAARRCSENSTPSPTRPSRARRSSASSAGNPYVELVHWIQQILQTPDSDLHRIVRHFEIDASRLAKDVTDALDRLPRGATSITDLSSHVENAVERGWVYGTLMFGESKVRTGHLVVGILKTASLRNALVAISRSSSTIKRRHADRGVSRIVSGSPEEELRRHATARRWRPPGEASGAMAPAADGQAGGAAAVRDGPDREGAQGRDSTPSSGATRRSGRSSTS